MKWIIFLCSIKLLSSSLVLILQVPSIRLVGQQTFLKIFFPNLINLCTMLSLSTHASQGYATTGLIVDQIF
jgi:hypothetical protein